MNPDTEKKHLSPKELGKLFRFLVFWFLILILILYRYDGPVHVFEWGCDGEVVKIFPSLRHDSISVLVAKNDQKFCKAGVSHRFDGDVYELYRAAIERFKVGEKVSIRCVSSNYMNDCWVFSINDQNNMRLVRDKEVARASLLWASESERQQKFFFSSLAGILVFFEILRSLIVIWRNRHGRKNSNS